MRFFSESRDYSGPIRFEHRGRHSNSLAHSPPPPAAAEAAPAELPDYLLPWPASMAVGPGQAREDGRRSRSPSPLDCPIARPTACADGVGAEQVCVCVGVGRAGEREIRLGTGEVGRAEGAMAMGLGRLGQDAVRVRRRRAAPQSRAEVVVES